MGTTYMVTAEYVTLVTGTPDGPRLVGFYRGATVPADVPKDAVERHLRKGLIEPIKAAATTLRAEPDEVTDATGSRVRDTVDVGDAVEVTKKSSR